MHAPRAQRDLQPGNTSLTFDAIAHEPASSGTLAYVAAHQLLADYAL
jgi:hypothetical protein